VYERRRWIACAVLTLGVGAACWSPAQAAGTFPRIPIWAYQGAYQDLAHTTFPYTQACAGLGLTPLPDSVRSETRTVTVRFLRDRVAEARPDFGGYRIYRVINTPDSTQMVLVRRFSVQDGDAVTWFMSKVDTATLQFRCGGQVVHDSIATFVDPDSSGDYKKICPKLDVRANRCLLDSVLALVPPPGPHDGFSTYYAITYELLNTGFESTYDEIFVPDTLGIYGRCTDPNNRNTCPNLNNKLANLSNAVEPTAGPQPNLERVLVVPNPYRAHEEWDLPGTHEIHFINLPDRATIRIYTVAGDLVRKLEHFGKDPTTHVSRDFEAWDLKNANGKDVASGIYMYRVESDIFAFQSRFIVIR
jgi:hypothetical protein